MMDLDDKPLNTFRPLFGGLISPQPAELNGIFLSRLVGPAWLRTAAPSALALGGLGGWLGKEFLLGEQGLNLVQRRGTQKRIFPFLLDYRPSRLDGKPAAVVCYVRPSPFPWGLIIDELRWLDEQTLLGMTLLKFGPHLAVPFVLQRQA